MESVEMMAKDLAPEDESKDIALANRITKALGGISDSVAAIAAMVGELKEREKAEEDSEEDPEEDPEKDPEEDPEKEKGDE